ncbi:hypothetical protein D3C72_1671680 [compost metagenome]
MRDQVDADLGAIGNVAHAVDREAHAVDGDRALVGQEARQRGRCDHAQLPAFADRRKEAHMADAVHVARDDVAAEAVARAQGLLEVDAAAFVGQAGRLVEGLRGNVDGELPAFRCERGDRHAGAVERDAVAEPDVVEVAVGHLDAESLAVGGGGAEVVDGGDAPHAGDDSGEHFHIFADIEGSSARRAGLRLRMCRAAPRRRRLRSGRGRRRARRCAGRAPACPPT